MKKILLIFIALLMTSNHCFGQNWTKLSQNIKKKQVHLINKDSELERFYLDQYHQYRKAECLQGLEINALSDTIYILEMYDDSSTLEFLSSVWNDTKIVSYKYNFKTFIFCKECSLFTSYMMKLVSEWNILEIRKEEEENGNLLPINYIYATRVIFKKNKYEVDCIKFKNFLKPERDSFDICE